MKSNFFEDLYWEALRAMANDFPIPDFVKSLPKYHRPYSLNRQLKKTLKHIALRGHYEPRNNLKMVVSRMEKYRKEFEQIETDLYHKLNDKYSRDILIKVLLYRIMGPTKIRLPYSSVPNQKMEDKLNGIADYSNGIESGYRGQILPKVDLGKLRKLKSKLVLHMPPRGINVLFGLRQYEYQQNEITIIPEKGDVVLDCGGCWGDTALYFAEKVGENGQVFSFEFIPSNLKLFNYNLRFNPKAVNRISLVQQPLWGSSNVEMFFYDDGPASLVSVDKGDFEYSGKVRSITIDDLMEERKVKKVDFIKMDIEGAEPFAISGARETIKQHKPKLAISIYHDLEHFSSIPRQILEIYDGYKFYLNHYTDTEWETVLFAVAE